MTEKYRFEPRIEVTATPTDGKPQIIAFSFSTASLDIAGSTVPIVAKRDTAKAVDLVTLFVDQMKESYVASEDKLVIKMKEVEKIDRGWFTHMDVSVGGKLQLDGGTWEGSVKGTPKKELRTKETTIEISLEKKDKKE